MEFLAGLVLASLILLTVHGVLRALEALRAALHRRPAHARLAELRGLRLRHTRAAARAEGRRAAELAAEVRRLRAELAIAQRDRARAGRGDAHFVQAKRAFARLFHPDRLPADTEERARRLRLFQEFWPELERIERN